MREIAAGNPLYAHLCYSYKDVSDRKMKSGRTFSSMLRVQHNIDHLKAVKTPAGFRPEGWGYGPRMAALVHAGDGRGGHPERGPATDADSKQAETGRRTRRKSGKCITSLAATRRGRRPRRRRRDIGDMRAQPRVETPTSALEDWYIDFVHAYLIRDADATQWAGIIHRKHQQFGYTGIILDAGAGGGGTWIRPELKKEKQIINGAEVRVRPIATEGDADTMIRADFILSMFARGDELVKGLWPDLNARGDDVIIDAAHTDSRRRWRTASLASRRRSMNGRRTLSPDGRRSGSGRSNYCTKVPSSLPVSLIAPRTTGGRRLTAITSASSPPRGRRTSLMGCCSPLSAPDVGQEVRQRLEPE